MRSATGTALGKQWVLPTQQPMPATLGRTRTFHGSHHAVAGAAAREATLWARHYCSTFEGGADLRLRGSRSSTQAMNSRWKRCGQGGGKDGRRDGGAAAGSTGLRSGLAWMHGHPAKPGETAQGTRVEAGGQKSTHPCRPRFPASASRPFRLLSTRPPHLVAELRGLAACGGGHAHALHLVHAQHLGRGEGAAGGVGGRLCCTILER